MSRLLKAQQAKNGILEHSKSYEHAIDECLTPYFFGIMGRKC